MTFPILGGNGAVAGFSIDNSLRFNDGDSAHISRTIQVLALVLEEHLQFQLG